MEWVAWIAGLYALAGAVVVGWILIALYRDDGLTWREMLDDAGTLFVCFLAWPLIVWAVFHQEDGE